MRIGVMVGPERGRYGTKVERLARRRPLGRGGRAAPRSGCRRSPTSSTPSPRRPSSARETDAHRDRHRRRPGPAPAPDRPRPAGAVGPGRVRGSPGARPRRVAPLDHRRDARPALRAAGARRCATYLDVLDQALAGPGPGRRRERARSGSTTRSTSPTSRRPRCCSPRSGPMMLRLAGERTDGTILWMADERAIAGPRRPPPHPGRRGAPAGRRRASSPASRCACAATTRSTSPSPGPTASWPRPRCRRTTSGCSTRATPASVGDILAAGSEAAVEKRLRSFADAGVTDVSVRVVPIGDGRDELIASAKRTRDFLADLAGAL